MTPFDLDLARRCQRVLDDAAAERRRREARAVLEHASRGFGHDSFTMLRASDEHAFEIMQRGSLR